MRLQRVCVILQEGDRYPEKEVCQEIRKRRSVLQAADECRIGDLGVCQNTKPLKLVPAEKIQPAIKQAAGNAEKAANLIHSAQRVGVGSIEVSLQNFKDESNAV